MLRLHVHSGDSTSALDVRSWMFHVQQKPMSDDLTADEIRALLKLEPHATCGFVRASFIINKQIAPGGLPALFVDGRAAGYTLNFMVTPDAPVHLNRIRNDQLYHYNQGD